MDRQLIERMVGAGILLAAVVIVAPLILDGRGRDREHIAGAEQPDHLDLRTHTIHLDGQARQPPVPRPLEAPDLVPPEVLREAPVVTPDRLESPEAGSGEVAVVAVAPTPEPAPPPAIPAPAVQPPPSSPPTRPPPSPAAAATVATGGWYVQLGAFSERANADKLAGEVRRGGFAVVVTPLTGTGATRYRVRVGPVASREEAVALSDRLAEAGYRGQLVR